MFLLDQVSDFMVLVRLEEVSDFTSYIGIHMNFDNDTVFILPTFQQGGPAFTVNILHPNKSITDLSNPEKPAREVVDLVALIDSLASQGRISQVVADNLKVIANKLVETDDVVINGVETQQAL